LPELALFVVPFAQDLLGTLASSQLVTTFDHALELNFNLKCGKPLLLYNFRIHHVVETILLIIELSNASGHTSTNVAANSAKDRNNPTSHVLAAMIASSFSNGEGATVSYCEMFANTSIGMEVSAGTSSIQACVSNDNRVRCDNKTSVRGWHNAMPRMPFPT
jgi:hypothetical protein